MSLLLAFVVWNLIHRVFVQLDLLEAAEKESA
jgi:hypothetical protein